MSIYRFVLRNPDGQVEELGPMLLHDDREAVAFGERMVRDLVADNPTLHAGFVMEVIDGNRTVGRIGPEES